MTPTPTLEFRSKAETLELLARLIPEAHILPLVQFTVHEWTHQRSAILARIDGLGPRVIVRSSAANEDTETSSAAGRYTSVADVPTGGAGAVGGAVDRVIASYGDGGGAEDRVLVQPYLGRVRMDGVVFTRDLTTGAPYYVISYSESGHTDQVTAGREAQLQIVARNAESLRAPWDRVVASVRRIEALRPELPLDIEFAIDAEGCVRILQVRPLVAAMGVEPVPVLGDDMADLSRRFERYSLCPPHLFGRRTIFSDMADWNPSEMIGDRPAPLAYSLYRYLITDETWHQARTRMGYFDASPGQLMTSFAKKPYIDTRLSFNSLTPAALSADAREPLVNFYLDKLEATPALHDKVEHDILLTSYEFGLDARVTELVAAGFPACHVPDLRRSLHSLTSRQLGAASSFFEEARLGARTMEERRRRLEHRLQSATSAWEFFTLAHSLLCDCRYHGTLPFSVAARYAFIAKQLLMGIDEAGINGTSAAVLSHLTTVATQMREHLDDLRTGVLSQDAFLELYGHLRPGSYDICAPRYRDLSATLFEFGTFGSSSESASPVPITVRMRSAVDRLLWLHQLPGDHEEFFAFVWRAMRYRELLKFEFTKNLSLALECYAKGGECLGLSRDDVSMLTVIDLDKARNPESDAAGGLQSRFLDLIATRRESHARSRGIRLPAVIAAADHFSAFAVAAARPNFVGRARVDAPICVLESAADIEPGRLAGRIVLIESADPGFDWVLTQGIAGLVTKYGGATSHMAIRCSELRVPGAIGCGEVLFERLRLASAIRLDCENRTIDVIGGR